MKSKRYTKKMLTAWQRTVRAYEKLIETGDESGWYDYGDADYCRLCRTAYSKRLDRIICERCVLGPEDKGCSHKTMGDLMAVVDCPFAKDNQRAVKRAARARLAWMKKKVSRNLKRTGQENEI